MAVAFADLKWSGEQLEESTRGKTHRETWLVQVARAGDDPLRVRGLPQFNAPSRRFGTLRAQQLLPRRRGPLVWDVEILYTTPEDEKAGHKKEEEEEEQQADRPTLVDVTAFRETLSATYDVDGNAIVNSAGRPLPQSPPRDERHGWRITVETTYGGFPWKLAEKARRGIVNANKFSECEPGTVRLVGVEPAGAYDIDAAGVRTRFVYHVFDHINKTLTDAHKLRVLDEGYEYQRSFKSTGGSGGTGAKTVYVRVTDGYGRSAGPALLDGKGNLLRGDYPADEKNSEGLATTKEQDATAAGVFLVWPIFDVENLDTPVWRFK